jgi:hypothetical protein
MKAIELIEELKKYPPDAIVGTRYGLGNLFKSIAKITSHKAHIIKNDEVVGETTLIHLHNIEAINE